MSSDVKARLTYWSVPAVAALAGLGYLIAAALGGHFAFGLVLLLIMLVFAAGVLVAGRRSETVAGLLDRRDERIVAIDMRATAAAGAAVTVAILAAGMVELARNRSGAPYTWLAAIEAGAYVVAVVVGSKRG